MAAGIIGFILMAIVGVVVVCVLAAVAAAFVSVYFVCLLVSLPVWLILFLLTGYFSIELVLGVPAIFALWAMASGLSLVSEGGSSSGGCSSGGLGHYVLNHKSGIAHPASDRSASEIGWNHREDVYDDEEGLWSRGFRVKRKP